MPDTRFAARRVLMPLGALFVAAGGLTALTVARAAHRQSPSPAEQVATEPNLPTGKVIEPTGEQTAAGSFPNHLLLSPDGRFVVVSSSGSRSFLSVLDSTTGKLVSKADFNTTYERPVPKGHPARAGLYYGLAFGPASAPDGSMTLYASRGSEGSVSILTLAHDGKVTDTGKIVSVAGNDMTRPSAATLAGIALTSDGKTLIAANNTMDVKKLDSAVLLLDPSTGAIKASAPVPGYPFSIALKTAGAGAGHKVYAGSEQKPVVSVIDPVTGKILKSIATGAQPIGLAFDSAQTHLFAACADSDTLNIIDTATDTVTKTILLRPSELRGLTGATPTGVAVSPDDRTAYVSLADMNAVAVVDIAKATVTGYIPAGWYPSSVAVSSDGKRLFVANAKGVKTRNPNNVPFPPAEEIKYRPKYIQSILEGTVSTVALDDATRNLPELTRTTLAANHFYAGLLEASKAALSNPGIQHIFYIIKENRTYDQVLGDIPDGNGDKSLVMFGREVTPNLHALEERFVLLDNFYCCAEVSGDGWSWSTGGMASQHTARNVPYSYTGRNHPYDYEGSNNGVPVDRFGVTDVSKPENSYIWDQILKAGMTVRNYGFFTDDFAMPRTSPEQGTEGKGNEAAKKSLIGKTDNDFKLFNLNYADSDAWVKLSSPSFPKQMKAFGSHNDPSRISAWRREFDGYVKNGNLPRFSMLRLGVDHTQGTTAGAPSPRAYVADNDYAIGQLVDAVSHSPYWKSSAIFVIEDDAQNGEDHVDAHRSTAYVISPFVKLHTHDSRFYNTDSVLHTMECLMGLPPLNQYVAVAPAMAFFGVSPDNDAPFDAVLPSAAILAERNKKGAYRSDDSARIYNPAVPDTGPDSVMNDILWHAVKGIGVPEPSTRHGMSFTLPNAKKTDPDGDGD